MKIDLPANLDVPLIDVFQVWIIAMLLIQAFAFFLWIRHDMKRCSEPADGALDRGFGA